MAIFTCAVKAQLWDSHKGTPIANAVITATLNAYELHQGIVAPHRVQVRTDANGIAMLELFPNALGLLGTYYDISIQSGLKGSMKAIAVVPDQATVDLFEILNLDPYPAVAASGGVTPSQLSAAVTQLQTAIDNIEVGAGGTPNALRFDQAQALTDVQQKRAAVNMGVGDLDLDPVASFLAGLGGSRDGVVVVPGGDGGTPNGVRFDTAQALTDVQQKRAALNIGVGDLDLDPVAGFLAGLGGSRDGVVTVPGPGGTVSAWGDLTGNIENQTDLMQKLALKANMSDLPAVTQDNFALWLTLPGNSGKSLADYFTAINQMPGNATGVAYVPMTGQSRTVASKLAETRSILDFGAIGTRNDAGYTRPLSMRFTTLAAAQAVYPFVTSLADEQDWAAMQAAVLWALAAEGRKIRMNGASMLFNRPVICQGSIHVVGDGATFYGIPGGAFGPISDGEAGTPALIMSYPTGSTIADFQPGPLAGSLFIFTGLAYYTQFEDCNFRNARFAVSFAESPNSPLFSGCNFEYGNVGVFYYKGCQNPQYINCGGSTMGCYFISSATAFPAGSPYAVNDNYFTDLIVMKNVAGYNSYGCVIQNKFDVWFRDSIMRPGVLSYGTKTDGGGTVVGERYVDKDGVTYPDNDYWSLATGCVLYAPFRHQRICFSAFIEGVDTRGTTPRSLARVNAYIHIVQLSSYSSEGAFSYDSSIPMAIPMYLDCGSIGAGKFELTNRLGYVDLDRQEVRENGRGADVDGAVKGTRLFYVGAGPTVIKDNFYAGQIRDRFYAKKTVIPVRFNELTAVQPNAGVDSPMRFDITQWGALASNGETNMMLMGEPQVIMLPNVVNGVVKSNAIIGKSGQAGFLEVSVMNLSTGESDFGRFYVDRYENETRTLAQAANNGDTQVKITSGPDGNFGMASLGNWRFDGIDAGFAASHAPEFNGTIAVVGRLTGIPGGTRAAGQTISRTEKLRVVRDFQRGWVSVVNGANGGNTIPDFGYSGNIGIKSNLQVQADGLTKPALMVVVRFTHMPSTDDRTYATVPPTTGLWQQKAVVHNSNPAPGGYEKWICTASGTPGTWKGVGLIAA